MMIKMNSFNIAANESLVASMLETTMVKLRQRQREKQSLLFPLFFIIILLNEYNGCKSANNMQQQASTAPIKVEIIQCCDGPVTVTTCLSVCLSFCAYLPSI